MKAVRWEEIPEEPVRPGVSRRAIGTGDVLLVMNECQPGMDLRPHSHDFDQFALIISGKAIYHVGDDHNEVGPGSVMLVPAGVEHYIEPTGSEPVLNLDVFAPARQDYLHLLDWMTERLGVEVPARPA
jgi:mannose-6-phosphate isomerase-like protein (cupin superfamily)